jgi:hypothetical protein
VIVTQDPSSASAVYSPPARRYSEEELNILQTAASILNCEVADIIALARHRHPYPQQQQQRSVAQHPPKRMRVETDTSPMATSNKSPPVFSPPGHHELTPREGGREAAFAFERSRLSCLPFCSPCTTSEPPGRYRISRKDIYITNIVVGYSGVSTPLYGYETKPAFLDSNLPAPPNQPWSVSQPQVDLFAYEDSPRGPYLPEYTALHPTRTQPSTRHEEMTYQRSPPDRKYPTRSDTQLDTHMTHPQSLGYDQPPYVSPVSETHRYTSSVGILPPDGDGDHTSRQSNLDIASSHQRPPPAKRGPFKNSAERERTAETRKIGSCIRCRMQRIRVSLSCNSVGFQRTAYISAFPLV